LKRLCARSIAENFESMIKQTSNGTKPEFEWFFPLSDWYIAPPAADILLEELGNRKKLTKEHFSLFLNPNIGMHSVSLRNIYLTPSSISFLKDFALYKLTAENVRGITLNDLIDNLSKSTFKDLHTLNVSRISFDAQSNGSVVLPMEQFKNLQHLNISNTKINSRCLNDLVKFLPRLRYLDISETEVNDITSLKDLKETLVGLIMHQIPLETDSDFEMALSVLLDLKELRVLDLSHIGYTATLRLPVVDLFIQSQFAPHLKHLDISGNPFRLTRIDILDLIKNHSNLQFLGLIAFNTDLKEFFEKFPTLEIIDGKGEEQITKIIKRYVNRPFYLKCAFESISESIEIDAEVDGEEEEHIFTFNLLEKIPPDVMCYERPIGHFQLVISTLEGLEISYVCFPEGIMSIVNLTKSLTWKDLPVELLNRLMNLTFRVTDKLSDEMFFYPCQDIFLHLQGDHRISFDYKRYCELLFHNLRRFHFATSVFHTIHLILNNCLETWASNRSRRDFCCNYGSGNDEDYNYIEPPPRKKRCIPSADVEGSKTSCPPTLRKLCVKAVAENFDVLIQKCSVSTEAKFVWRLPYPDFCIAFPLAEMILEELGAFQNLQWLNIGGTKVDSVYLEELVKYLPRLKYLDISETKVNNITPLKVLKENLNGLIIHCLPLENDIDFEMTLSVLLELKELRVLDVSHYETAASSRFNEIDLFIHSHFAPQIRQLDISGNPFRLTIRDVMEFMKNHSNLRCLGLVLEGWDATELCAQFPNVDIFGGMGEEQIRKTIKRCLDRPCYLTSAFNNISNELNEEDVEEEYFTSDLLELVVRTLENLECLEECSAEGLKSITYLISNLKLENIAHELLNRLTTLLFLAAEKWDNEIVSFWCHEIFLEIKEDRRITFDYKRYCNILFLNLDRFRDAFTKFGAVQLLLNHCFPGMTEADLNEVGVTPTYMKCLIKNAAEIYLEESEVLELIVEGGDERLHYLRDFCKYEHTDNSTINCIFQPYIFAIIKKLIAENLGACRLAIEFGGIEVMTQILQGFSPPPEMTTSAFQH
uniref:TIR domain-containing protein n=1 Tax=Hymenolepis diminuta TaxID=6216 RepID=A0A158QG44_HYMDI